jgi:proteasome accessory factor C
VTELHQRLDLLLARHGPQAQFAPVAQAIDTQPTQTTNSNGRGEAVIRPERFARLVTLAGMLIRCGRQNEQPLLRELCELLQITENELREDISALNIVNFGAGSYVLYAEIDEEQGSVSVDPEPYGDSFARPARLAPVEAKALIAAIDLLGEHLPHGSLQSAREKIVNVLGEDPAATVGLHIAQSSTDSDIAQAVSKAIADHKLMWLEYYKESEDSFSERTVEPYALINGRQGWYVAAFDLERDNMRHFRLDRIKQVKTDKRTFTRRPEIDPIGDIAGWPRTGKLPAARTAKVWISPQRARWAREEQELVAELTDESVIVERSFAGTDWLVRQVLREAGDAAILEPQDARAAVLEAATKLRTHYSQVAAC